MPLPETAGRTPPADRRPIIFDDTPPEVEERVIEGYRAMSPAQRLGRVVSLNRALEALAAARVTSRHGPGLSPRELRLRLGSLRISRQEMIRAFDWDPVERGY